MKFRLLILSVVALSALTACSRPAPQFIGHIERQESWDRDFVERMGELPVQDNGRIKPLMTFASFLLYQVHGRRDMKFQIGEEKHKLDPVEWLLDVWCFPDQAADYPLFRIENVGVLDALSMPNDGQKLDFVYKSFREVLAHSEQLEKLGRDLRRIDRKDRNAVQEHILQLYNRVLLYYGVHQQMGPLHHDFRVDGDKFRQIFDGREMVKLAEIVQRSAEVRAFVRGVDTELASEAAGNARTLLGSLESLSRHDTGPSLLPPAEHAEEEWHSPLEAPMQAVTDELTPSHGDMFAGLSSGIGAQDMAARVAGFDRFQAAVVKAADVRGEYGKIPVEADYYRDSWHFHAMFTFVAGFLIAVISWLLPRKSMLGRLVWWASMAFTLLAFGLLAYDITLRCIITGRPPIKNLYDTFLFIAAFGVLTCVVVEWIMKTRIALALAPLCGAVLIMLARSFELADGKDTMDPLMAVLDSNYWLATHVTSINTGYAAGIAAAILANAWVLMRVFRVLPPSDPTMKGLIRAVYGVTCFSLLVSLFGTIYGGVWANDSWGRFWGWDPKENGALMICLSQIAMLHARWCGWVRDFGIVLWASLTGMVVLFSWFHTNLLGVGLHSYGFSAAMRNGVWIGYMVELGFMLVGAVDVLLRPNPAPAVARSGGGSEPLIAAD